MHRRTLLVAPGLAPAFARAQSFPTRPLRLIVTYPPGGVTDIMGRMVAEPLGRALGQSVIVENRAGAGGNIGTQAAALAEPDGHTLLLGTTALFGVNPLLYAATGVDALRDFVAVGVFGETGNVLSVHPRRLEAVRDVAGLIAELRRRPLLYGSVGNGSSSHMSAVAFLQAVGMPAESATHVPYRGSGQLVPAMLAGDVDFMFDTPATSTAQVRAGAVRALAVTTTRRASALPEVPTLIEAGLAGFDLGIWFGLFTPARTPATTVARLRAALGESLAPPFADRLRAAFTDPLAVPEDALGAWLAADAARWRALAQAARLSAD